MLYVGLDIHDKRIAICVLVRGTPYTCAVKKVLIFSGCNSQPATGSLQPVAIVATRGGNETVGAFETDGSLWRLGEPTGRNSQ